MKLLNETQIAQVSGGEANWGETAAGIAAVTLAVAVAASPVGLFGAAAATGISYFGGTLIGSGLMGLDVWQFSKLR